MEINLYQRHTNTIIKYKYRHAFFTDSTAFDVIQETRESLKSNVDGIPQWLSSHCFDVIAGNFLSQSVINTPWFTISNKLCCTGYKTFHQLSLNLVTPIAVLFLYVAFETFSFWVLSLTQRARVYFTVSSVSWLNKFFPGFYLNLL